MAVLGLGSPQRRPLGQAKLGPAPPRLLLLAGQPLPERRHEIVVGQLVVFLRWLTAFCILPCRFGRRDGAEPRRPGSAASSSKSLGRLAYPDPSSNLPCDCMLPLMSRPCSRQEGLQDRSDSLLVRAKSAGD